MNFFILLIFFTWGLFIHILSDYVVHKRSCNRARKFNKPICKCWDCKSKCDLYPMSRKKDDM